MNDLRSTYRAIALRNSSPASDSDSAPPAATPPAPEVSTVSTPANKTPVAAPSPLFTPTAASNPANPAATPPFAPADPSGALSASTSAGSAGVLGSSGVSVGSGGPSVPPVGFRKPSGLQPSNDLRLSSAFYARNPSFRRDPLINRSIITPGGLYRSESSYFQRLNLSDSIRFSTTMYRSRPDSIQRSIGHSVARPSDHERRQLLDRMVSVSSVSAAAKTGKLPLLRQQVYYDMKERQLQEVQQLQGRKEPPLLTYLRKKATHGGKKEAAMLVFTDEEWVARREEKREKEDFLLDVMFKDSQVSADWRDER